MPTFDKVANNGLRNNCFHSTTLSGLTQRAHYARNQHIFMSLQEVTQHLQDGDIRVKDDVRFLQKLTFS